jgi:anaerobic selenocysteine-containing dehydrogenase
MPPAAPRAQATPPRRAWGYGEKLRVRGLTNSACGLPTAALADEILLAGEGQIRALICVGGNPVVAWPDQPKTLAALRQLELCVALDIKLSATARLADYVIAPKLSLEVPGFSLPVEAYEQSYLGVGHIAPYARYTPAIVDPPAGSDVIEEWEFFYGLAQRMSLDLRLFPVRAEVGVLRGAREPVDLDMQRKPSTDELFELLARNSQVPLERVKQHPNGALFAAPPVIVAPRDPGCDARLELGDATLLAELAAVLDESEHAADARFPFRLVSRRLPNVYNSSGHDLPALHRGQRYNPAFLHPKDLEALGVASGEVVTIRSDHGSVLAVVESAAELRRGVISMAHCFGGAPEGDVALFEIGSNTGRLVSVERSHDPYTGIPRMSAIPVAVERFEGTARGASPEPA